MTVKSYDSKCRDLAERFLDDYSLDDKHRRELAHKLAIEIQDTIETFLGSFEATPRRKGS